MTSELTPEDERNFDRFVGELCDLFCARHGLKRSQLTPEQLEQLTALITKVIQESGNAPKEAR
jgi:hypothetical protein